MKIGIDARMLGPQCAGLGRYVEQMVLGLERTDHENDYVVFLRKENWERYAPAQPNFKKALADIPWYGWREQIELPRLIRQERVDFMHFPHWNVPLLYRGPFIVTIHDLIMWHYPRAEASTHGPLVYWLKDRIARLVLRSAARRAKKIVAVSEYTKQDIHQTLGIAEEKIIVTYQVPFGLGNQELRIKEPAYRQAGQEFLKTIGIVKPYVLYVGSAYPHKNLERLVDAWSIVEEKTDGAYELVLAGKDSPWYEKISKLKFQNSNVIFTGFVEDDALDALYRGASLYVAPSLYEGYALPALEAIQRGIPVAASNRTCFPEVLGEAAVYFDPENIDQMANVIIQALTNDAVRMELLAQGQRNMIYFRHEHATGKQPPLFLL